MEIDTQKDIDFYSHLINTLGQEEADRIAPEIFSEDLSWMSWEACRTTLPKAFFYKIVNTSGELRLVNQRDLLTGEDILGKIDKAIRGGLEFFQMSKVRSRLFLAETGAVVTWISPKKLLPADPPYPLDQINIAKKIDEETVWVKQLQGDFIKPDPTQTLEDLMFTLGDKDLGLDWKIETKVASIALGQSYFTVIKQGYSTDELRMKRTQLLNLNEPTSTSCGTIDFGGSFGSIPSWCERCGPGNKEIICKFCKKALNSIELKSHRCVC